MKKLLGLFLALTMLFTCCAAFAEDAAPALTKDVVVLFTSDVHCGIDQGFGYAGLAAIRDELAKTNHVVLVDNGDAIQGEPVGTMTTGEALVKLMNAVGYDVLTMGNHEFDYGMDRFLELAKLAEAPYVSCNFTYKDEAVFNPYVIKEFDGVKIAFVGVTTPKTFTSSTPTYFQDENGNYVYGFCEGGDGADLYAAVQKAVDAARAEGAQYVILQAHLGIEEECAPWMSSDVIANTTGIDALLDGHSHSELTQETVKNKDGESVLLSACGTKLANIGYLKITKDGKLSTGLYTWKYDVSFPALMGDTVVAQAVAAATEELNAKLSEVVAQSQVELVIKDPETGVRIIRNAETNLGDLCADAYRAMSGADVAFVNGGGIRTNIAAGDITLNDILKVHPFGNAMCMVECSGQQILDALEWTARNVPGENGGFLQVSGLTYEIHTYIASSVTNDDKGAFTGVTGEYRVKNVMVGGEPLDLTKTYTLASHNYMLKSGGDGTCMFKDCKVLIDESMLDNQVLINYITTTLGGVVGEEYANPYGQGRIVAVPEAPAK
ncbi:MAG: bifunctional metallophosphatase/5'-nucleotidase [Aristaeellaceae bacterium]